MGTVKYFIPKDGMKIGSTPLRKPRSFKFGRAFAFLVCWYLMLAGAVATVQWIAKLFQLM